MGGGLSSRRKPSDRGRIDTVASRDIGTEMARRKALKRFLPLEWGQLRWATKSYATGLRTASTLTCARTDQLALKLRQAAQYGEHETPVRSGRICPYIGQRPELGSSQLRPVPITLSPR